MMNSRFKFRAWDITSKKMRKINSIYLWQQKATIFQEGYSRLVAFKEIDIEQWTGLKDINGVEIYEGDVLNKKYEPIKNGWHSPTDYGFHQDRQMSVSYDNGRWMVSGTDGYHHLPEIIDDGYVKVGTIHENINY